MTRPPVGGMYPDRRNGAVAAGACRATPPTPGANHGTTAETHTAMGIPGVDGHEYPG